MTTPRQLLYISSQPCPHELHDALAKRHWELVGAKNLKAAGPLLRRGEFRVALVVFDGVHRDIAADVEACREANDLCEWVGLVPPGSLESTPLLRDIVLRHFFDHHTQPADPHFLCQSLGHAFGRAMLRIGRKVDGCADDMGMAGRSAAMTQLRRLIRRCASSDACVLIEGESGTGKELAARAIHACSPRVSGPFVALNCATVEGDTREQFESAAGGTLFLDQCDEMPLDWQARLLRFLAEQGVLKSKLGRDCRDVRVIASCETPLAEAVANKRFRQDLFYRLNVIPLAVPPLRQRREDIELLAQQFHAQCIRDSATGAKGFSRRALSAMKDYTWPGNVRELFNRVQRAVTLAERRIITPADLGLEEQAPQPLDSLEAIRVQAEKNAIALSLDRFAHNVSLAARELGVSRMTMYRLMAKHSITPRASV